MIEAANTGDIQTDRQVKYEDGVKKVLRWRKNERMGGMVPVWEKASDSAKGQVENQLSQAATGQVQDNFNSALAYAAKKGNPAPQEFGFGDLVDMVNPLQHLPLVGHVYREITGDDIRPISQIIGGGLFGGPAGAAGGLFNTIIEYETGKDVTENVVALVAEGRKPAYRNELQHVADNPEKRLNDTVNMEENPHNLPGSVIGFSDLGYGKREAYERAPAADGRTAGTVLQKSRDIAAPAPSREPITQVTMSPMPLLNRADNSGN